MNCTFSSNEAGTGGGMFNDASSTATVTNCILWGDTPNEIDGDAAAVTYSCVQGGYTGNGNIADDPSFVDAENGNLRLSLGSPCIDTGFAADGAPSTDILGVPRPQGTGFDMGAYEYYVPLAISQQPVSQTVPLGQPVTFTVGVSGGLGTISFEWQKDDMPLDGGDQSAYTIASAQLDQQGSYTCLVTDDFNAEFVESNVAILTVIPGMPVAGGVALAAAVLAAGLLGALRLRRRKEE